MPRLSLPKRLEPAERRRDVRSCPAHRAWVRRYHCCVPGCTSRAIECAHVRTGTDGGMALKPSDRWAISLCRDHHQEQHRLGEQAFETRYAINLHALAEEFARKSPHLRKVWAGSD